MKRILLALIVCMFGSTLLTVSAQQRTAIPSDIPKVDVEKYTLPNGLEVILSENHRLPLVAVDLWYHVGPVNEAANRTGFAHLFEHMMFQGSKHVANDSFFKILEGAGASDINGTTDFDRTNYFETVPSNQLETALWLESDRMGYLIDKLDQEQLSNQQDVVRNERRESHENQPYGIADETLIHMLFAKEHPYYGNVIGSHADIQAAKLEDVRQFFKLYYRPNNATIAIVGDIDKAATKKLIEKYFGPLKRGVPIPQVSIQTLPLASEKRAVVQDRVQLPRVYMSWITPAFFKDGDADADMTSTILGGGNSSRLYKKLVYEKQIAQSVAVYQQSLRLGSIFEIEVTARQGHTPQELEAAIQEELVKFRNEGPTQAELQRAQNRYETDLIRGLQRLGGFGGVADLLNLYNHYVGNPDYVAQDITRHRNVTVASAKAFAQRYLGDNARAVVHCVPGTPDWGPEVPNTPPPAAPAQTESINDDAPWRAAQPKPAAAGTLRVPVPQSFQLANGLTVIVAENPNLPLVAARVVVRSGSDSSPLDEPGLANFTVAMLDQGTATRSSLQLADDFAQLGSQLSVASTMDASRLTSSALKRNFPAVLGLLADVAMHPSFPAEEVERQRASRLSSLAQQRSNPNAVANLVLASALWGRTHPYGFTELGTAEANKKITRDDLQAFWKEHFVPSNAALILAGAVNAAEARKLAEDAFGLWANTPATPARFGEPTPSKSRLFIVDRPGLSQTTLRIGLIAAPRSSPDYLPLRVLNEALGGLFSSRINLNLREAHGYTYGAGSQFVFRRQPAQFVVYTNVRADATAPAVQEILNEVRKVSDAPITADELAMSKDSIERSLPALFESNDTFEPYENGTVATLGDLFIYQLPLNYYSTVPAQLESIAAPALQALAKKYLAADKLVVAAVGDKAKIQQPLEAVVGPAELRDPDGAVVTP